jgi:periplasmic protein TonB
MKNNFKNWLIIFLLLNIYIGFSQQKAMPIEIMSKNENKVDVVKDTIELKSEPFEGFKIFYSNVQKSIRVPENEVSGVYKTKISFFVDTDGTLTDFKISNETPKVIGLGEEVIRVLKTFPKWKPSSKKTYYILPVSVVIENEIQPTDIKK